MKKNRFSLNVRLLAILVLVGGVSCVGVYYLHKYQLKRLSIVFLDAARGGVEDLPKTDDPLNKVDKIKEISQNYTRYLVNNPDDIAVQSECALFFADKGKSLIEAAAKEKDFDKKRSLIRFGVFYHNNAIGFLEDVLRAETEQSELRAKLVNLFFERGDWTNTIEHIRFLVSYPPDAKALAKLFDRYDLWKRVSPPVAKNQTPRLALAQFLSSDTETVDREKLLAFLGDDLWIILDDTKLLEIYGRCQVVHEKYNVAENSFEKAISRAPDNPDLYEQLALVLRWIKPPRTADADYWMNEMVDANPASYIAKLKRARYWNMVAIQDEHDASVMLTRNAVR
ncbi:MAG: hypothetical protein U9N87_02340, partial [Planctomycetota bacterium]|nr:hypothetical protein [Planctomycetota bacterium]